MSVARKLAHFFSRDNFLLALFFLFLFVFSITIQVFATPPASPYIPGETNDPTCVPTDTYCFASPFPDQTGNAGEFLSTNGTVVSWAAISAGLTVGTTAITSGTANSVLFEGAGNVLQENSVFVWDNSTTRLGLGIASPTATLHVKGIGATSATNAFTMENSSATKSLTLRNDGAILRNGTLYSLGANGVTLNTTWGLSAGAALTSGEVNTYIGDFAGQSTDSGSLNIGLGVDAGYQITSGSNNIAIGVDALTGNVTGSNNVALGGNAGNASSITDLSNSVSLGAESYAHSNSIAIGYGAQTTTSNQLVFGRPSDATQFINDVYFGASVARSNLTSLSDVTLNASGGNGTDNTGTHLNFAGGKGTGTGVGGNLVFKIAYPTTTSSNPNSLSTVGTFLASNKATSGTQNLISLTPTVNQSSTAGYTGLLLNVTETATGSGTKRLLDVALGGATKFNVANNGDATITGSVTTCTIGNGSSTTSCSASDERLKDEIRSLSATDGLSAINALDPVSFNWNTWMQGNGATDAEQFGFIAQDVKDVFPNLVSQDHNTHYFKLDYQGLAAPMVKAIQELDAKVEPLASLDEKKDGSLGSLVKKYLEGVGNGLKKIFVGEVHTDKLCIGDTCVTEAQLIDLLHNDTENNSGGGGNSEEDDGGREEIIKEDINESALNIPGIKNSEDKGREKDDSQRAEEFSQ